MKVKPAALSALLVLLSVIPCYAEPPGALAAMLGIYLVLTLIGGALVGLAVKVVLFYARIEAAKNWQVFLGSTIAAGLVLAMLLK